MSSSSTPSGSRSSSSQRRNAPPFKPLKRLHQNSLSQFKAQKPSTSAASDAKLTAISEYLETSSLPCASKQVHPLSSSSSRNAGRSREPAEVFCDRNAPLNEKIGALAKTQWARMDTTDRLVKDVQELRSELGRTATDIANVDSRLNKTLSKVRSTAEWAEECNETSKTVLDIVYVLREECVRAVTGDGILGRLDDLTRQNNAILEQNEVMKREHEVNRALIESLSNRLEDKVEKELDMAAVVASMSARMESVENALKDREEIIPAPLATHCCSGHAPNNRPTRIVSVQPVKKPRRSTRQRKSVG